VLVEVLVTQHCPRCVVCLAWEVRAALFTPAVHRLSNVYDERRPTYDGVGAAVTQITREVRALARWEGETAMGLGLIVANAAWG